MKKFLVFILVLVGFLTFGFSVVKAELVKKSDGDHVAVQIKKGWNLVPVYLISNYVYGSPDWSLPGLSHEAVKAIFLLDAESKKYISFIDSYNGKEKTAEQKAFESKLSNDKYGILTNSLFSGAWVYSTIDGSVGGYDKVRDNKIFDGSGNGVWLYAGWNFFAVPFDLLDRIGLQSIQGNCQITKVALWEANNQSWKNANEEKFAHIMQKEKFSASGIGEVIALKVAETCKLSSSSNAGTIGNPPAIPN